MNEPAAPSTPSATELAVERTRLAYERTLMAWIRTATSLITFGFTIYKFFQIEMAGRASIEREAIGARGFALLMIVSGLVALLVPVLEHRQNLKVLNPQYPWSRRSLASVLAALIGILGVVALIAVIFRE